MSNVRIATMSAIIAALVLASILTLAENMPKHCFRVQTKEMIRENTYMFTVVNENSTRILPVLVDKAEFEKYDLGSAYCNNVL